MNKQKLRVLHEYFLRAGLFSAGNLLFCGAAKAKNWKRLVRKLLGSSGSGTGSLSIPPSFQTLRMEAEFLLAPKVSSTFDLLEKKDELRGLTTEILHCRSAFAVNCKETKLQVGLLTLTNISTSDGENHLELGYRVHYDQMGKGLATEMVQGMIAHLFQSTNLNTIVSVIQPGNLASEKVAQKVGMTFDVKTKYRGVEVNRFVLHRATYLNNAEPRRA